MRKHGFRDYGIRPRGSPEVACDPLIMACIANEQDANSTETMYTRSDRQNRASKTFSLIIKTALKILPAKQRKVFFSVWVRSDGHLGKGVMEFSRRTGQSHYTNYNNYYKAMASIQTYLKNSGYEEHLLKFLHGGAEEIEATI